MIIRSALLALPLILYSQLSFASDYIALEKPPESLQKWYKPANKRQVWLHTMFKLRREMQAIHDYSKAGDYPRIHKWLGRFDNNYNKMGEMVPEWKNRIKPELITELASFVQQEDTDNINKTLNSIRRTCNDCHDDYQPLVTMLYRTPLYDEIEIIDEQGQKHDLDKNMASLSRSVNEILIALDDDQTDRALQATDNLVSHLQKLGQSCNSCHKDDPYPEERILGEATQKYFITLKKHIQKNQIKESKQIMGTVGVNVCSRCHNTHRTLYELRKKILHNE